MAIATAPTALSIVTESLKKAGFRTPTPDQVKRGTNEWVQEVFNDIWLTSERSGNTKLKTLQTTAIAISVDNQRRYNLPTDFSDELSIVIMDGANKGTAQTGTQSSVTLESGEDITQATAEGKYVLMTGGTSKGQYRQILTYNATTLVATVEKNFDNAKTPVSGDTYLIVDNYRDLDEISMDELDEMSDPTTPGFPSSFAKFGDEFYFDKPFDAATYGLRLRYYANIHKVDLTEGPTTLITKMYTNWQGVLKLGVQMKAEESISNDRYLNTKKLYDQILSGLILKELPFEGEFQQFTV